MSRSHHMLVISTLLFTTMGLTQTLPHDQSTLFAGSGVCGDCHMPGGMNPNSYINTRGEDISPPNMWSASMMANAAKDPFWQAKVQAEIEAHPELQAIIEDKCTTCHAPMGRVEALYNGTESYTLDSMRVDPLAMDGVSCAVCHQIQDLNMGEAESFSGHFEITDDRMIYGPFQYPITGPMNSVVNFDVSYSEHTSKSELCATCHTLFTPYVDDDGAIAGEAPEQVPYLEWLNSDFPGQGIECQTCHMPATEESIVISNRPAWLNGRSPVSAHEFVGGNVFMMKIMRDFGTELGVRASPDQFDSTIARTMKMLTEQSVNICLDTEWNQDEDTLGIQVTVQNLSGHKFPTAYPSRRAWLELEVIDVADETVFHSGAWDETGEISGLDSSYEVHHQLITSSDQVQIYQNIARDVNGDQTYTLLRFAGYLKDNRIPPVGYVSDGPAIDSTRVEGLATLDPDFNRHQSVEGSGADIVHFQIGELNPEVGYKIIARINYQTLAPRFAADLFSYDVPKVNEFQTYYNQVDLSPILLDSVMITLNPTDIHEQHLVVPVSPLMVEAYPNPFNPETHVRITLNTPGYLNFMIYNIQGRLVQKMSTRYLQSGIHEFSWDARNNRGELVPSGVYLLNVEQKIAGANSSIREQVKLVYLN